MKLYRLQGETIEQAGLNWYGGRDTCLSFEDVIFADYAEKSSSAGDWSGFAMVKRYNKFYIIPFQQENCYPYNGYRLHVGEAIANSRMPFLKDEILNMLYDYYQ